MKIRQPFSEVAYQAKKQEFMRLAKRDSLTEEQRIDLVVEENWKRLWSFCFSSKQEAKTKLSFESLRPLLPYYKKALETTDYIVFYQQIQEKRKQLEKRKQSEKEVRASRLFQIFDELFPVACFLEKQDASLGETTMASLYKVFLINSYFSKGFTDDFQQVSPIFLWQAFQLLYLSSRQIKRFPERISLRETYQTFATQVINQSDVSKQELLLKFFEQGTKDLPADVVQLARQNMSKLDTAAKMQEWKTKVLQTPLVSNHPQYQAYVAEHGVDLAFLNQQLQQVTQEEQDSLQKTLLAYKSVYPLAKQLGKQATNLTEAHYQRALLLKQFYGSISLSDPELYWQGFQHAFYANDLATEVYLNANKQKELSKEKLRKEWQAQIREDDTYPTGMEKLRAYLTKLYPLYFQTDFRSAEELIERMEKHIPVAQHFVKKLGVPSASHTRTLRQLKQRVQRAGQLKDSNPSKTTEYEKAMADLVAFPIAQKLANKDVQLRHLKEAKILMELCGTENALSYSQPRDKLVVVIEILRFQRTLSGSPVTKKQLNGVKQAQKNYHYIPHTIKKL